MLEIKTLGGLHLFLGGERLEEIGSHKAEAIMVYLAVENKPINRQILAAIFWPESAQENASMSLRAALHALRKPLGEYLQISRDSVQINPGTKIDFNELKSKLAEGEIGEALQLYQGDFLAGFQVLDSPDFEAWQLEKQIQIKEDLCKACEEAIKIAFDVDDYPYGLNLAKQLLQISPLDEIVHQQCMLLYAMSGDRLSALTQYEKCVDILQNELGVEPSRETQDLYQKIVGEESLVSQFSSTVRVSLPELQTSFIGRKAELFHINKVINQPNCRLLTLIGPGGCGKTRLALEAAKLTRNTFPDGVCFVPLESCHHADLMIPMIARAIDFEIDTIASNLDPETQLIDYLRHRRVLIVLDGFEKLVPEAPRLTRILEKAANIKLLVTSRQKLDLMGEWPFPINGFPVPDIKGDAPISQGEAVQLFVERANQVNIGFQSSSMDLQEIIAICQIVEGMPLGIELAAAWTSVLPLNKIRQEVAENLEFLKTSFQDIPEKHRSIQAVFDSSWAMLNESQQCSLYKLSIFQGDFNPQAAACVTQVDPDQLSALVERSLVARNKDYRFSLHSLIKQFVYEKLAQAGELPEIQARYAKYYIDFLIEREPDLIGERMLEAREEIRKELPHVLAATRWICGYGAAHEISEALIALCVFTSVHGWHEGVDIFNNLADIRINNSNDPLNPNLTNDPVIICARSHQAFLLSNLGQIDRSEAISRACLEPAFNLGLQVEYSLFLHNLGVNASFRGEYETARSFLEKAIQIGKDCDCVFWKTYLLWLGHVYFLLGEYEQGLVTLQKCYDLFMETGTLWGAAFALSKMGLAADGLRQHEKAIHFHREAFSMFEKTENKAGKGYALSRMSMSTCFLGNYEQALQLGEEAYDLFNEIGHRWGLSSSLSRMGFAYCGLEQTDQAQKMFIKALEISNHNQMIPLSLYALAGFSCTLIRTGQLSKGIKIIRYVNSHPKTPKAYLDQALSLLGDVDLSEILEGSEDVKQGGDLQDLIDEVLDPLHLS